MISLFEGWLSGLSKNEDEILKNLRNPDPNFEPRYKFEGDKKEYHKRLSKLMLEYEKFTDTNNFFMFLPPVFCFQESLYFIALM